MRGNKVVLLICAVSPFICTFLIRSGYLVKLCTQIFGGTQIDETIGFLVVVMAMFAWAIFCTVYIVRRML